MIKSKTPPTNELSRALRRRVLLALGVILILLTFVGYHSLTPPQDTGSRTSLAIIDFANNTGDSNLDGLSELLIINLEHSRTLDVLTRTRMFDILRKLNKADVQTIDEETGRVLCKAADVDLLAVGTIDKSGELYSIDVKVIDAQTQKRRFAAKSDGKGKESVPSLIDRIAEQIRSDLQEPIQKLGTGQRVSDLTTPNLDAFHHFFLGEQLVTRLNFEQAAEEFQQAVEIDPNFALAYYRLAYCYDLTSDERGKHAIRKAAQLIEKAPPKEKLYIEAESDVDANDYDQAIRVYKDVLNLYPSEKEALFDIGDLSYHLSDYQAAENYLQKALSLDPFFERALQHLIWVYRDQAKYGPMKQVAEQYLTRLPQRVEAYTEFANAFALQGDLDKAQETLVKAEQLFPNDAQPVALLGAVLLAKEKYPEAETEFRKLLDPSAPPENALYGHQGLAMRHMALGRFQDAIQDLDRATQEIPKAGFSGARPGILSVLKTFCSFASGAKAETAMQFVKQFPAGRAGNDPLFYEYLVSLQLILGQPQKAAAVYKQEPTFSPLGPLLVRAYLQKARSSYEEAIRSFLKGTQNLNSNSTQFFAYDLADCYRQAGNPDQAIRVLKRFQSRFALYEPYVFGRALYYAKSYYLLGKIYESAGDKDQAVENYQRFLEIWKDADPELAELVDAQSRMKYLVKEPKKKEPAKTPVKSTKKAPAKPPKKKH